MKRNQNGAALAVSLILVVVASMLGISAMNSSQLGERIAGNERQVSEAFMAAETGIAEARKWLDSGGANDAVLNGQVRGTAVVWNASLIRPDPDSTLVRIESTGRIQATETIRRLAVDYTPARRSGEADTAPIVMLGKVKTFYGATSNAFTVFGKSETLIGDDGKERAKYTGAAIQVDDIDALELILIDLEKKGRLDNYYGGFELLNCTDPDEQKITELLKMDSYKNIPISCNPEKQGDEIRSILEDPRKLSLFIESILDQPDVITVDNTRGKEPLGGIIEPLKPQITYFNKADHKSGSASCFKEKGKEVCDTFQFGGSDSGAGILIVDGNLAINGTPSFYGLIIVTGTSFSVKGGGSGGVLGGSIIFANPIESKPGEWSFGTATAEFDFDFSGGGTMTFQHDAEALKMAVGLMNDDARLLWSEGRFADDPKVDLESKLSNWRMLP